MCCAPEHNSTGFCGSQIAAKFTVPPEVIEDETKLRVVGQFRKTNVKPVVEVGEVFVMPEEPAKKLFDPLVDFDRNENAVVDGTITRLRGNERRVEFTPFRRWQYIGKQSTTSTVFSVYVLIDEKCVLVADTKPFRITPTWSAQRAASAAAAAAAEGGEDAAGTKKRHAKLAKHSVKRLATSKSNSSGAGVGMAELPVAVKGPPPPPSSFHHAEGPFMDGAFTQRNQNNSMHRQYMYHPSMMPMMAPVAPPPPGAHSMVSDFAAYPQPRMTGGARGMMDGSGPSGLYLGPQGWPAFIQYPHVVMPGGPPLGAIISSQAKAQSQQGQNRLDMYPGIYQPQPFVMPQHGMYQQEPMQAMPPLPPPQQPVSHVATAAAVAATVKTTTATANTAVASKAEKVPPHPDSLKLLKSTKSFSTKKI